MLRQQVAATGRKLHWAALALVLLLLLLLLLAWVADVLSLVGSSIARLSATQRQQFCQCHQQVLRHASCGHNSSSSSRPLCWEECCCRSAQPCCRLCHCRSRCSSWDR
jgi:hypothetical protein